MGTTFDSMDEIFVVDHLKGTRLLLDEEGGAAKISKAARREQEEAQGRHHACMVSW